MPARQDDCSKCGAPKERTSAGRLICRPCEAAYHRARREADPEANRVRCREYAARHREEARQRALEWHYANGPYRRARNAANYVANRESEREKRRVHYSATAEAYKERARRREARKRDAICSHGLQCVSVEFLRDLYGSVCLYCGSPAEHADHFQPLIRGGLHCKENLVPACSSCNLRKQGADPLRWLTEQKLID